jgi:hypothetical protein
MQHRAQLRGSFGIVGEGEGFAGGLIRALPVAQRVRDVETHVTGLTGAEKFAGPRKSKSVSAISNPLAVRTIVSRRARASSVMYGGAIKMQ